MFYLVAQAIRDFSENIVGDTSPVSRHKIIGGDSADSDEVIVGAVVAHNANGMNIGENSEELFELVFDSAFAYLIAENSVSFLKNLYFLLSDLANNADTKTGTREWLSPYEIVGDTKLFAYSSDFVFKEVTERLDNAVEVDVRGPFLPCYGGS